MCDVPASFVVVVLVVAAPVSVVVVVVVATEVVVVEFDVATANCLSGSSTGRDRC